ncbi:aconitase family protein [Burkholderia multivorans]|uniref:3-isopropylmalate dehydratase n=1 Tax=Burkholderia multivorans TaxID=87883 RepID=A0AB37AYN7_9BURK|nr:aconitase family protein [Burkholderia multivorans]PRE52584.1 3-isopropylmalate dehydratase [Burkholderia multivorans]PRE55498.1 3-isopropylmalate dehydratase [Burkholderia multivorans]
MQEIIVSQSPSQPPDLPKTVRFDGRILFLSQDPCAIERQLLGEDVSLEDAVPLRTDISTDEITPANICYYYDEKLGDYPYVGLDCGGRRPVAPRSVKAARFAVAVAGRRYGKGSSREASPYAEWCAGIRLVIAESFERIYRQNCHNLGLLTSTDFGLIARIRRGEEIPLEEFTRGEDALTAELIRRSGLFRLAEARRAGWRPAVPPRDARPMTYAEKIIARASGRAYVAPGESVFARADWRYAHEYVSPMAISFLQRECGDAIGLHDPDGIVCFADHLTFIHRSMPAERRALGLLDAAQAMAQVQQRFCDEHGLRHHGLLTDREGAEGISHSIMAERYVEPAQLVVGTDSHTPHCGALGALAFGIGATEMANAWLTGDVRVKVPATCRINLNGRLPPGVEAKDIVLHLLRLPYVREGRAIGQIIEYGGDALASLSTDERATLTNMVAEIGGFSGIVVPDVETQRFLRERRGMTFEIEAWMRSDDDADVAHLIDVDCARLEPMLARPGDPGNGIGLSELPDSVPVDIAYGGSCTGGKRDDLQRCHEVLEWALQHDLKVFDATRFFLQFGSQDVRDYCEREGMLETFARAGVELVEPGCGACVNAGPGVSERPDQVTISAVNRNFPGRSGPGQVWLASPSTVAASAVAGRIVSFEQLRAATKTVK